MSHKQTLKFWLGNNLKGDLIMFSKKKKIIILTIMVALLVVTGYLNIALNNNVTQPTSTTATKSEAKRS